jgi:hypothetical protein
VLNALQQSFLCVQQAFSTLNLVLNTFKTKVMWFGKKNAPLPTGVITTSKGLELDYRTQVLGSMAVLLSAQVNSRLGFIY